MSIYTNQAEKTMADISAPEISAAMVSVIVPVTERYDDLSEIYQSHSKVLRQTGRPFEFIFVIDDGFAEAAQKLEPIQTSGEPIRVIQLPRRFGEATALMIGFEQARGDVILTLPAYFQAVSEGLGRVLTLLDEGYDMVVVRRWPRIDSWINRFQNHVFHALIRLLTGVQFHDISCGVKGIRRKVLREIHLYGDLHRFLPLLAYQRGFRVIEASVEQHSSDTGIRVYHPGVYLRRLLDLLILLFLFKFTKKPLRFFGLVGSALFAAGGIITLYLGLYRILGFGGIADRPLLLLGVLLMVLGVQTVSIGLIGEIIIFTHARKMKDYTIDKVLK